MNSREIFYFGDDVALVILEGLDRTGKSTVAAKYEAEGYEIIHQSAPPKGQTIDLYLEEQIGIVSAAAHKDILLDRSYYGEFVWPIVYGRDSLLTEEGIEVLRELEDSVGTTRILMHDPNVEAHWKRCVDNKEPLTKVQFVRARRQFDMVAEKYGFERRTLQDHEIPVSSNEIDELTETPRVETNIRANTERHLSGSLLSPEQVKLETANAINAVLSKRILKQKGPVFEKLEANIRNYLNGELANLLGTKTSKSDTFTAEEVELLKFFCGQLKERK